MNKALIKELARRLKVTRQAAWNWLHLGLSLDARDYLMEHGTFHQSKGQYFVNFYDESYMLTPSMWGELKGLKELRASVQLLKDKERITASLKERKTTTK